MKISDIRFQMAMGLALVVARLALADWSTNWPSWSFPSAGTNHAGEVWAAVNERALAAGVAAPSTNVFFDNQYTNLANLKTKVAALLPYYVNTNLASDGTFTNWFNAGSNDFPVLSRAILAEQLKLPTNYLDFTPWSDLAGIGGNGSTNDNYGGIGHPFGWTNASTAAGGTNWAPGRTNVWFTTDYGWQGLKEIAALMRWTSRTFSGAADPAGTSGWFQPMGTTNDNFQGVCYGKSTWPAATADAEANYVAVSHLGAFRPPTAYTTGRYNSGLYTATVLASRSRARICGLYGSLAHTVQFYVEYEAYVNVGDNYYNAYGRAPDSAGYYRLEDTSSEVTDATVESVYVGNTNLPPPPWMDAPGGTRITWGHSAVYIKCLIQWDGASGFSYK